MQKKKTYSFSPLVCDELKRTLNFIGGNESSFVECAIIEKIQRIDLKRLSDEKIEFLMKRENKLQEIEIIFDNGFIDLELLKKLIKE